MVNSLDYSIKMPVLFLTFNRLDTTKQVFEQIRKAKTPRLYIASDGPREGREGEDKKVQAVRDYVMSHIDWDCEVKTLFRDKNLGCRYAVSGAIDWFFENEEMGIILEDDCLPSQSFFWFCEELLERYRECPQIMQISGNNFQNGIRRSSYSYYFSCYSHIWGWATWKRAWMLYDRDMKFWNKQDSMEVLKKGRAWKPFEFYWRRIFKKTAMGQIDSWAYIWSFSCWINGGLTVIPENNLVKNIGFGPGATHCKKANSRHIVKVDKIDFPLRHPKVIERCYIADRFTDKKIFGISYVFFMKAIIKSFIANLIYNNDYTKRYIKK